MAIAANPLPTDGVVGLLTPEQTEALKRFWEQLFELVDNAPRHASVSPDPDNPAAPRTGEDPVKDVPKDDAAKERARANAELQQAKLALEKYGSDKFMQTFWRFIAMDLPDALALKFVRARKWNSAASVAMFAACMKWRIESGVEDIFSQGEEGMQDAPGFLYQMTSGKGYLYGTDRHGRPVIYIHVRTHKASDQPQKSLEDFILLQMESLRCLAHGNVDKVTMCFDMNGFGLANMDWKCIAFIIKCLESYYPESLNAILVHCAPWVFQGIWKVLAPMLDPVVRAKVQMTKTTEDLCIHIPPEHLARTLGGKNSWEWKYPPVVPGENKLLHDSATREKLQKERDLLCAEFEQVTRQWLQSQDTTLAYRRETLAKKLRAQYFRLDPYIRGKGAYHRLGNIVGNGLVVFNYPDVYGSKDGQYEVIGHNGSMETLERQVKLTAGSTGSGGQESMAA